MASFHFVLLAVFTAQVFPHRISANTINSSESDECSDGFLLNGGILFSLGSPVALPDYDLSTDNLLYNFVQWIFPRVKFTCNGYIRSWKLRVNSTIESETDEMRPIPQITTWRVKTVNGVVVNGLYGQQSITNETQATVTISDDGSSYTYKPSQPIPVQSGDIVGITMPLEEAQRMLSVKPLYLELRESNTSTFSCVRLVNIDVIFLNEDSCGEFQNQLTGYIPMITAIIDHNTSSSTTPSPPTTSLPYTSSAVTVAPTHLANPTTPSDDDEGTEGFTTIGLATLPTDASSVSTSNQIVGIAVFGCLLVALVIAIAVVIIVLLVVRKHHGLKTCGNDLHAHNIGIGTEDSTPCTAAVGRHPGDSTDHEDTELHLKEDMSMEGNVAYGQAGPKMSMEVNVAFYCHSALQMSLEDNVAYNIVTKNDCNDVTSEQNECDYVHTS